MGPSTEERCEAKVSCTVLKASGESQGSSLSQHWQGDAQLEALLAELEQLATRPAGKTKRDPQPIDEVLGDIVALCYEDARSLEPHRMGALEL